MAKGAFGKFNKGESEETPQDETPEEDSYNNPGDDNQEEDQKDMAMKNITLSPESVDAVAAAVVEKLGAMQPGGPEPTQSEDGDGNVQIV